MNLALSGIKNLESRWVQYYDLNKNKILEIDELEKIPTNELAQLLIRIYKSETPQLEQIQKLMQTLPIGKVSRILKILFLSPLKAELFKTIVEKNITQAVRILILLREGPFDPMVIGQGDQAAILLWGGKLNEGQQQQLIKQLELQDPGYAQQLLKYDARSLYSLRTRPFRYLKNPFENIYFSQFIPQPISPAKPRAFTQDLLQAIEVLQHQYAIGKGASANSLIQTFGVGPCIAVTLWDPQTKIGMLAHFSDITLVDDSMDIIFSALKAQGADITRLQARILGGYQFASEKLLWDLRHRLEEQSILVVDQEVLLKVDASELKALEVMFNLQNGEVTYYVETILSTPKDQFLKFVQQIPHTPTLIFKHPQSF